MKILSRWLYSFISLVAFIPDKQCVEWDNYVSRLKNKDKSLLPEYEDIPAVSVLTAGTEF